MTLYHKKIKKCSTFFQREKLKDGENMNDLVYINNVPLKYIASLTVSWYDVSKNSGRDITNANGDMILNVINKKYRLDITTKHMTQSELQDFFSQIKNNSTMTVNFFNTYTGGRQIASMYRGDRATTLKWKLSNGSTLYDPVTIALIEL